MILKASQRGGGQNLAVHLMRLDDNEHMELHDLRGFVAEDLPGAFKEAEATSLGTNCRQYLFSLSLSPPEDARVPVKDFENAIEKIEERLGLTGLPRAIVFHEKEGRRHVHCVWSRIDAETMTARQLSFFKTKLTGISRELYLEHGWKMPAGIERAGARNPTNFSLAEWQQAKRSGIDPRWLKEIVQLCWKNADNPAARHAALGSHGLRVAEGDRRGFVLLDYTGEIHSLSRLLGIKQKDLPSKLIGGPTIPSLAEAKGALAKDMTPALRGHVDAARAGFAERSKKLGDYKAEMTRLHRLEREKLAARHKLEWDAETLTRTARLPKGLRGLWHRITGQYQKVRKANEAEAKATQLRFTGERDALSFRQLDQRAVLQVKFKELRRTQADLLLNLRRDLARHMKFTRDAAQGQSRAGSLGLGRGRSTPTMET